MTSKTAGVYHPIPSSAAGPNAQTYVVLPLYHRPPPSYHHFLCYPRRYFLLFIFLLFAGVAAFLLWPSDPDVSLVRLRLNHIQIHSSPSPSLDISLSLTLRVRNKDFFSLDYETLIVSLGYRGRELGLVKSKGGKLKARGSSYVDATLVLDGFEVLHDIFHLIEDVARGSVPFDTVSTVNGELGLLFIRVPLKGRVSCEVYVNPENQTIVRRDCYPE